MNIIKTSNGWLITTKTEATLVRSKVTSASEAPLNEYEKIIDLLCNKLSK